jgi:hypothetical protein
MVLGISLGIFLLVAVVAIGAYLFVGAAPGGLIRSFQSAVDVGGFAFRAILVFATVVALLMIGSTWAILTALLIVAAAVVYLFG